MEKKDNKKKTMVAVLALCALVLVIGATFAFITIVLQGEKENVITGGSLRVVLDDTTEGLGNGEGDITIENAFPVSDAVGKTQTPYTFVLKNESAKDASYTIFLDEQPIEETNEKGRISDNFIKVYLSNQDGSEVYKDVTTVTDLGAKKDRTVDGVAVKSSTLYSGVLSANSENTFVLRLFIASNADSTIMGQQYATKISVDAVQVPEYAVTVVNGEETKSMAVFRSGNAVLEITPGTGTPSVSCTNGMTGALVDNKVTVSNVTAHTVCTVTYTTE